jgi:hypothetical protein
MGFAGYVSVCVELYCVSFHCLSLHVSAYMAIFKCVGYLYFHMLEGFCFAASFLSLFSRGHTLHVSICVFPVLFSFVVFVVSLRVCLSACFFFVICLQNPSALTNRLPRVPIRYAYSLDMYHGIANSFKLWQI